MPRYCAVVLATNGADTGSQALSLGDAGAPWALPAGEVHVWRTSLEQPTEAVGRMRSVLARDEQCRADRFRFERDRSRYIVGRALLRSLLARYLQTAPEKLEFQYGEFRTPALRDAPWF